MSRPNRISKQHKNVSLVELIQDFDDKHILIPPHQREFCWDLSRQQKFIQSILKGYPIPSILMSSRRADAHPTLEDGRQRITTASRYRSGMFQVKALDGVMRSYAELSDIDKERFDTESVMVMTFSNANDADRIEIFDWHQNGAPLSPGERYHAQAATPLIKFVKEQLMTPGAGYHDRAALIWGVRGDPVDPVEGFISSDKRRRWLLNAVALIAGLAYGPVHMHKAYQKTVGHGLMTAPFSPIKQAAVKRDLERILEIYEAVNTKIAARKPKQWVNPLWDLGTYTGYIAYSLSVLDRYRHDLAQRDIAAEYRSPFDADSYTPNSLRDEPEEWARLKETWVEYMVGVRRTVNEEPTKRLTKVLEECIHAGVSKARNWSIERWEDGYKRVFDLPLTEAVSVETVSEEESDEE